jgi:hypothetical protein
LTTFSQSRAPGTVAASDDAWQMVRVFREADAARLR